jgi:hypothetical protein
MDPDEHPRKIPFEDLPIHRDLFLVGSGELGAFKRAWARYLRAPGDSSPEHPTASFCSYWAFVDQLARQSCDVNLCLDLGQRYHGIVRRLPKSNFVACFDYWHFEKRPYLIVDQSWLDANATALYSTYALVDAIGMKAVLRAEGALEKARVDKFRRALDKLAAKHPDHAFFSFADSVLIKTNWSVASKYAETFRPEAFLRLLRKVQNAFRNGLGLDAYAVVTQGANYYPDDALLKVSASQNHISLPSLGTPFAQLFEVDEAVRAAIRKRRHAPRSLYLTRWFFLALRLRGVARDRWQNSLVPFTGRALSVDQNSYLPVDFDEVLEALEPHL